MLSCSQQRRKIVLKICILFSQSAGCSPTVMTNLRSWPRMNEEDNDGDNPVSALNP